jgi:hypothetical protein
MAKKRQSRQGDEEDDASESSPPAAKRSAVRNDDENEEEVELELQEDEEDEEKGEEEEEKENAKDEVQSTRKDKKRSVASPGEDEQHDDDIEEEEDFDEEEEKDEEQDEDASVSRSAAKKSRKKSKSSRSKSSATTSYSQRSSSTSTHRPHSRKINPLTQAEAGIIRNIYLENFMCHRKLSVDFCPNVNFVNGDNGSGKSAILAAIQICLGATARRTGRGRNMRELVRDYNSANAPSLAKVRVSLANGGSDGYKQDLYGNVITVERTISNGSGFNGYKLLDESGKEQSRSRHELYEMLDHL